MSPCCVGASIRPAARCGRRCGPADRGWRRHRSDRRTRRNATVAERLLPRIRVIDAAHPLFGQPLEVSASGLSRRIGWIRVVLPDGRHRWVPQKATDLNVLACEAKPNRDLPLVSVRTLLPLAEYVRARLSTAGGAIVAWTGRGPGECRFKREKATRQAVNPGKVGRGTIPEP
jgi:hypothetical protein